ncbi:DUF5009 domain-containing protein [Paucibacter sp. Y2R2-4]|uniref:DUF5009 domain-containing protein n=1 Tax=Paucibacter sp. Y2R2-4 TaxID=2893553 RepID=UPI0021E391C1|nr:DUF5009 domain-containing protein [Paucibacter sp. Y2R2-4]MCV2352294.1 DUF5009 domain-containing protein [Paucibacter sp. Y2R2-4]
MASTTERDLSAAPRTVSASGWRLPQVRGGRILSIDAMRALTVLVMVMVNEWHSVVGLPQWMSHMPADVDAMSFVDAVFPSFLFIVGMSIPFALQQRFKAGDRFWQVQGHVLLRGAGLVLIGFFMVNGEDGFDASAMPLPIPLWNLLCYGAAFLLWGSVSGGKNLAQPWRVGGLLLFALLAWVYRGAPTSSGGQGWMTPQWWGILGLIGWAYLIASWAYQAVRGSVLGLLACVALCTAYFVALRLPVVAASPGLSLLFSQDGNFVHGSIALCGVLTTMIFFDESRSWSRQARFGLALLVALLLALAATGLRPDFKISKIHATPSWALYSAAASVLIFAMLYQWVDVMGRQLWPALLAPVAANPLLAYLIPFVIEAVMQLAGWHWPELLRGGGVGLLFGAAYSVFVALLVKQVAGRGLRLSI